MASAFHVTPPYEPGPGRLSVLALAPSRSAAARLAPVLDALGPAGGVEAVGARTLWGAPVSARESARRVELAVGRSRPGVALLAGDGDEAVDCALTARRLEIPVARIGAGLRSGDRGTGDEINRIVLDGLATRLYADSEEAVGNLRDEGLAPGSIRCVGSTLSDVVRRFRPGAVERAAWRDLRLPQGGYVLVAVHRPEAVGDDERVARLTEALAALAHRFPVVLCLSSRLRGLMEPMGDLRRLAAAGVVLVEALAHLDFLSLESAAGAVVTDSAAIQEETTLLGVRCYTLRAATERVATLTHGTNVLLGDAPAALSDLTIGPPAHPQVPIPLWDGAAGARIADDLRAGGPA